MVRMMARTPPALTTAGPSGKPRRARGWLFSTLIQSKRQSPSSYSNTFAKGYDLILASCCFATFVPVVPAIDFGSTGLILKLQCGGAAWLRVLRTVSEQTP